MKLPPPASAAAGVASVTARLQEAHRRQLDGALLRTVIEVTPTLDHGALAEVRACADDLGMYLEMGVGKVNPYMTVELPHVRALGGGSYLAGMERMIAACAEVGCRDLWTATGNYKPTLPWAYSTDRCRTDAPWRAQLASTERFLVRLAPCLRHFGSHLNLESHEEITSFELVRLVEAVGDDVLGVTFDSANVAVHGELAESAARRLAPWVRMTHIRDVALWRIDAGVARFLAPCGEGLVDWGAVLLTLGAGSPGTHLTIEDAWPDRVEMTIAPREPGWRAAHPDLTTAELERFVSLAREYELAAGDGQVPDLASLRRPDPALTPVSFVERSAKYLRERLSAIAALALPARLGDHSCARV